MMAAGVVLLGTLLAPGLGWLLGMDEAAVLGVLAGATTNTPSLGAAQQTLAGLPEVSAERAALPALAYAVTYPAAIIGIIGAIILLKRVMRIDPMQQAEAFADEQRKTIEPLQRRALIIENPNLDGSRVDQVPGGKTGVVISRIKRRGATDAQAATGSTLMHIGDTVLAVGTDRNLDEYQRVVGRATGEDLLQAPSAVTHRRVIVTNSAVLGKTVGQLGLEQRYGVTVTRVSRADVEMTAAPNLSLQFGDVLQVVGQADGVGEAAALLGNSLKALNQTHFVPLFAGILAGIALGTLPLSIPGLPQPLRLGLAGGPLVVAILVSRVGRIGPLVWHMPLNANLAFREFGIALFFASVGLMAGPQFFTVAFSARGAIWLVGGIGVTMLPLLLVGWLALAVWRMNFVVVSGFIAGSMTDPPALAFATNICGAESPMVAYAAVYPLTTLTRILAIQVLAVVLCG
jgi:putative transport protein